MSEGQGPIEIRVKIDRREAERDLNQLREKYEKARAKESVSTSLRQPAGAGSSGGFGFGLEKPAFPSGSGGLGVELPKAAQKEIAKTIGDAVPKLVKKEIAGIDWLKILKSFSTGGLSAAAKTAVGEGVVGQAAATEGVAAAVGGEAAAGAAATIGGVATGLGVAALVALVAKKVLDDMASNAGTSAILTGILVEKFPILEGLDEWANAVAAKLELFKAAIDSLKPAISKTIDLESARLRLGQSITAGSVGSDFEKIRQQEQNAERLRDRIKRDATEEAARNLVKSIAAGGR